MKLTFLEALPILAYIIILLIYGLMNQSKKSSARELILGTRSLTLPAFVATLVTTWYGGILGVGEFTYLYGISNWLVFGVPYYVFAILFALFLAPKIKQSSSASIPELITKHYGPASGLVSAIFVFLMTIPAPYILMLGLLVQLFTGWNLLLCLILGASFSVCYIFFGGFNAVVKTDKLQFILMFAGFIILLLILIVKFGGYSFLKQHLPAQHLQWHGGNTILFIASWYLIASITFIDPGFHQRCTAAQDGSVARKGILISVGFWIIFDFLTTSVGLYAKAILTDINPVMAFPLLGKHILPPLLSGLFFAALLAIIMSTIDSNLLLSATAIGYDFFSKIFNKGNGAALLFRIGLFVSCVCSIALAYFIPSVVKLWYIVGNLIVPPLLLPVVGCFYSKVKLERKVILLHLIVTFFVSLAVYGLCATPVLSFLSSVPPMYFGLFVSFIFYTKSIVKSIEH